MQFVKTVVEKIKRVFNDPEWERKWLARPGYSEEDERNPDLIVKKLVFDVLNQRASPEHLFANGSVMNDFKNAVATLIHSFDGVQVQLSEVIDPSPSRSGSTGIAGTRKATVKTPSSCFSVLIDYDRWTENEYMESNFRLKFEFGRTRIISVENHLM